MSKSIKERNLALGTADKTIVLEMLKTLQAYVETTDLDSCANPHLMFGQLKAQLVEAGMSWNLTPDCYESDARDRFMDDVAG